ncbi:MAG: hypothetical protein ACOX0Z_04085 [Candidatus Nanosyncoccaceae bacterium]|jgi:hypothetical protein
MKKSLTRKIVILIVLFISLATLIYFKQKDGNFTTNLKNESGRGNKNSTNIIHHPSEEEIKPFTGDIYINGEAVPSSKEVIVMFQGSHYLSKKAINKYVSESFISKKDNLWLFRKNRYNGSLIQSGEDYYFPLEEIDLYIRANSHHLVNGVLYLDTSLPSRLNYDGSAYHISKNKTKNPSGKYADLTADGREIWRDRDVLWVLDDSGDYTMFTLPSITLD